MSGRALTGLLAVAAVLAGCGAGQAGYRPTVSPSWSPSRGARLIEYYGCGACHAISGISGANGRVGAPLVDFVRRYREIAGVMPNTPANLVRWIMDPPRFVKDVAMPDLGVSRRGAEDIAAYLERQ